MDFARVNNQKMGTVSDHKGTKFAVDLKANETQLFSSLQYFTVCKDNKVVNMIFEKNPYFKSQVAEQIPEHDLPW